MPRCGLRSHEHCDHGVQEQEWDSGELLTGSVALASVYCLNELESGSAARLLAKGWEQRLDRRVVLRSAEDDPELLLHVPFLVSVQVRGLLLGSGAGLRRMRIWANREDVDFGNCREIRSTQDVDVAVDGAEEPIEYQLKVARFSNCSSLTVLFEVDEQELQVDSIEVRFLAFMGKVQGHRREAVNAVYEARPVPKGNQIDAGWGVGARIA